MKILELFSGTESFSKVARARGHEVFTVDIDKQFNPDLCGDILSLGINEIPFIPDVIWASPPCTCFSVASISTHWTGGHRAYIPKTKEAEKSIELIKKTLSLIRDFKPKFWFIENPRGVLRKMAFMEGLTRHTVTYCQYGDNRMKPTDIWTNLKWKPKPMCKNGDSCHVPAPRGSKTGTQGRKNSVDRSKIPEKLCLEIIKCCEDSLRLPKEEFELNFCKKCYQMTNWKNGECAKCNFKASKSPKENLK